jgi:hypothetical protein
LNQSLLYIFQSRFDEKISTKVRGSKVNHLYTIAQYLPTTEGGTGAPVFNQGLLKNFQSGFA